MKKKILDFICIFLVVSFAVHICSLTDEKEDTRIFNVYEGHIFSDDGTQLTVTPEGYHICRLEYPEAYSPLIGYATTESKSGLRNTFEDYLWNSKKVDGVGNDITLTLNHDLQLSCYNIISKLNANSSVVVIENATGGIKALVSTKKDFVIDANNILEQWDSIPSGGLIPEWSISRTPGSTFKIISSVPIIVNGLSGVVIHDTEGMVETKGGIVHNYGCIAYGETDLKKALQESSNVYFAKLYDEQISASELKETAKEFKVGSTIELDFIDLKSNYNVSSPFDLVQTSFGQGKTEITPIHLAMIMSSVITGELAKPHLISRITDENGEELYSENRKQDVIGKVLKKSTAAELRSYLMNNAASYGLLSGIYAKSGTAEIGSKKTEAYMVSGNSKYTVVVSTDKSGMMGVGLKDYVNQIYGLL